jgi:hypothetical protein
VEGGLHYRFTAERSVKMGTNVGRKVFERFDEKYTALSVGGGGKKGGKEVVVEEGGGGGGGGEKRRSLLRVVEGGL